MLQAWVGETVAQKQTMNIIHYLDFVGKAQQFKSSEGVIEALKTKSRLVTALERGMKK